MKIVALQAENIKKLIAVEIRPDGNMVQITGKNGQGKTSVLDSIWWALGGASNFQKEVVRKGADRARIRLDLGEIIITRTFKTDGPMEDTVTTSLSVENAEGTKFSSPQAMLDGLLGQLSFDPLAFARMDAKKQFDTLRAFVPDVDFDMIETQNRADYEKRTILNRRAKEARASAGQINVMLEGSNETISEDGYLNEIEKAAKFNADIETRRANRSQLKKNSILKREQAVRIEAQIATLTAEHAALIKEADEIDARLTGAKELPEPISVSAVRAKLDQARLHNSAVLLRRQKNKCIEEAQEFERLADELTHAMERREEEKQSKVAAAELPVDGLSFGDGQILMKGVPFEQASDAEQLRASIAIAMALNPKLRVIRVRDGSLLDEHSMELVSKMADVNDYQVWIERVDGSGKVGFILEDGHVRQPVEA